MLLMQCMLLLDVTAVGADCVVTKKDEMTMAGKLCTTEG
jgi:hypothetical protein